MASKRERTAYIHCLPVGISESVLKSMLNNNNHFGYSVDVCELKQRVAVVKICGDGVYNVTRLILL